MSAPVLTPYFLEELMGHALALAQEAAAAGEVPVGAVVAKGKTVVGEARNEIEQRGDPTAHAEVLAIRRAAEKLGNWRLRECVLCVTLEPCIMCAGAVQQARLPVVAFGAPDEERGGADLLLQPYREPQEQEDIRIIRGIREKECKALLDSFFAELRLGKSSG